MKSILSLATLIAVTAASLENASAYLADGRTITVDPLTTTARLYTSPGVLAPMTTVVWWVADTGNNGVNLTPEAGAILGGDDVLILADAVDGGLFGSANPGKYLRSPITVSDTLAPASIYFYVWNAQSATPATYVPQNGSTFGIYNVGVVAPPAIGNAFWGVNADVFANTYVVGVPEPSTYLLGGLGLIGLATYRRFKK